MVVGLVKGSFGWPCQVGLGVGLVIVGLVIVGLGKGSFGWPCQVGLGVGVGLVIVGLVKGSLGWPCQVPVSMLDVPCLWLQASVEQAGRRRSPTCTARWPRGCTATASPGTATPLRSSRYAA